MKSFSLLIGGKAGFGIDTASLLLARIISQMGYRLYIWRDYPSLIRGGHTFSVIRAGAAKLGCSTDKVDFVLALNQDTVQLHEKRLTDGTLVIYDEDTVKSRGLGIRISSIVKQENAAEIMRNTCMIGAFCKAAGISWDLLASSLKRNVSRDIDLNLRVAWKGYEAGKVACEIETLGQHVVPVLTGNEGIGLGLVSAGLESYLAYPMTPSSGILHFLAGHAGDFGLEVIHPENEIAVMLMALGFAYAGRRSAVGTSGGGFCLMTEGLSLSGMAELPVVVVLGQRPGPSTGLPTYSAQTDLLFALSAGQGEFPRMVIAPSDAEDAFWWSQVAMSMAWKYQIPVIILSDKNMAEASYSFDVNALPDLPQETVARWDGTPVYKRYVNTKNGVSPLAFPGLKDAVVKVNSYEHDEFGVTTEDPGTTTAMQDKRLRKESFLAQDLAGYPAVATGGKRESSTALLCWGSNRAVVSEVAAALGVRMVCPTVLWPFPIEQLRLALSGVTRLVCVENNATGQLATVLSRFAMKVDRSVHKYDGRPFSVDELEAACRKAL